MADIASLRAASDFPVFKPSGAGIMGVSFGTFDILVNPTAADVLTQCKAPPCTVIGGYVYGDDLDTNATETLDFDVGWLANGAEAADPDGLGNFGVVTGDAVAGIKPEVAIWMPIGGLLFTAGPQVFTRETTFEIVFNVTAATSGLGFLTLVVHYVVA